MIKTKIELKEYIKKDLMRLPALGKGELLFKEFNYYRRKFMILLRKCEYYKYKMGTNKLDIFSLLHYYICHKSLTKISNMFNLVVPLYSCESGLLLCHPNIIINGRVGTNATFHGNNCLAEKNGATPTIGNDVEIGYGTIILGGLQIEDNCIIGANSFINKNCHSNSTYFSRNVIITK